MTCLVLTIAAPVWGKVIAVAVGWVRLAGTADNPTDPEVPTPVWAHNTRIQWQREGRAHERAGSRRPRRREAAATEAAPAGLGGRRSRAVQASVVKARGCAGDGIEIDRSDSRRVVCHGSGGCPCGGRRRRRRAGCRAAPRLRRRRPPNGSGWFALEQEMQALR